MRSNSRSEVVAVFDDLAAGLDRALKLSFDTLTVPEILAMLDRCERLRRRLPAVEHPLINALRERAEPAELGGKLPSALADRLHITRGQARRRIAEAADLGARRSLTGQPLAPVLPATAAAQRRGRLNTDHVQIIRGLFAYLPDTVDPGTCAHAEAHLAKLAAKHRPDELARLAGRVADYLHPDGNHSEQDADEHRAKRRSLLLGPQNRDGMSAITGWLDPQARATLEAVLARWAAPGMCNPADLTPCTDGTPGQHAIDGDTRSTAQRNHDALTAMARAMLASGDLGQHNGLPATIIVSAELKDLEAATGTAHTGGGSALPITDVIRLASHAHHWLRIYDGAKEVALFHTKRLASPGQRIVLHARDRGCAHPGCTMPGYFCQAHHTDDYAHTGHTDIHNLSFRCHPHHDLITTGGWKTRKRANGTTETLPPAHLDHGQPRTNHYHHPEKLLQRQDGDDDDDDGP